MKRPIMYKICPACGKKFPIFVNCKKEQKFCNNRCYWNRGTIIVGLKGKKWLQEEYEQKRKSTHQIAREIKCRNNIVSYYLKKYQIKIRSKGDAQRGKFGEFSHYWKGGRLKTTQGYIRIANPKWPGPGQKRYVFEHRYQMEVHLNRPLNKDEHVHHINSIRDDNRIENLTLISYRHSIGCKKCPLKIENKRLKAIIKNLQSQSHLF